MHRRRLLRGDLSRSCVNSLFHGWIGFGEKRPSGLLRCVLGPAVFAGVVEFTDVAAGICLMQTLRKPACRFDAFRQFLRAAAHQPTDRLPPFGRGSRRGRRVGYASKEGRSNQAVRLINPSWVPSGTVHSPAANAATRSTRSGCCKAKRYTNWAPPKKPQSPILRCTRYGSATRSIHAIKADGRFGSRNW